MKKLLTLNLSSFAVGAVVLTLSVLPALSGTIATPFIAGDFQGWNPSGSPMTSLGSGLWSSTFTGLVPNSRHAWKVTDGTWGTTVPGANSWLFANASGNVTITYDGNTYADGWSSSTDRLGLSTDPGAWTAVGDWQGWNNANPSTVMSALGGGIYQFSATLAPGTYAGKAVVSGSWDSISLDTRSINTANWSFTTDAINNTAIFRVDSLKGVAQVVVTAVPEPATLALVGCGLAGLLMFRRRQ